jgi:TolB protein
VPNWSDLSNVASSAILPDTLPPAPIVDLAAIVVDQTSIRLEWTAPADAEDGFASSYDVRYAEDAIDDDTWESATVVPDPPIPAAAGEPESLVVADLTWETTYHFAIRSADVVPNWSELSNVAEGATIPDTVGPDPVTDLAVVVETPTMVSLVWQATGDDGGVGTAAAVDLRLSTEPITEKTWADATPLDDLPNPSEAGSTERYLAWGLEPEVTQYLALRVRDEAANWSPISNVVEVTPARLVRLTVTTSGTNATARPAWSPDGTVIAYVTDRHLDFNEQVYFHSLIDGEAQRVTNDANGATYPSWSPDGGRIAYRTHRYEDSPWGEDWETGVWTQSAEPFVPRTLIAQHGNGAFVHRTSWSPDGKAIAYSVYDGFPPSYQTINVVVSAGGPFEVIVNDGSFNRHPAWSPLGDRIAFGSDRTGNLEIWLADPDGSALEQLTTDPSSDSEPTWSPDGQRIAFVSDRSGNLDLWLMNADGSGPTALTVDPAGDYSPSWSPDGTMIAFTSDREHEEGRDVWILAVDDIP